MGVNSFQNILSSKRISTNEKLVRQNAESHFRFCERVTPSDNNK